MMQTVVLFLETVATDHIHQVAVQLGCAALVQAQALIYWLLSFLIARLAGWLDHLEQFIFLMIRIRLTQAV